MGIAAFFLLSIATFLTVFITQKQQDIRQRAQVFPFKLFGVNMAGAEFGEGQLPGVLGTNYIYPSDQNEFNYFTNKGLTLIRIPFRWERVQNNAFGPLSPADISGLRASLDAANNANQKVILDMHNYARYYNAQLQMADAAKLADVWKKLALEFRNHPALWGYEIMNEPHDLAIGEVGWKDLAQAAVDAIRTADTTHFVLIPGYSWQSADRWPQVSDILKTIVDPVSKLVFAAHQYFDSNASGSAGSPCVSNSIGVTRVNNFINWLHTNNKVGILTEYGANNTQACLNALDNFLKVLQDDSQILGGTYWAAGPWWGDYPYSVDPGHGNSQIEILSKYSSTLAASPTVRPTSVFLPADIDKNGCVGILDFNAWFQAFKNKIVRAGTTPDVNGDGNVGLLDFNLWFKAMISLPKDTLC